ncbi:MAG: serine/threonine-protein kinase [Deltaproteobacteria bacterium]|nr:serine/threonine-protein kinase [Deltaproteobacteria bacterium]
MLNPGDQIGAYAIVKQIGAGGMGEVFLARHRVLGRKAAIKVLLPDVSRVPEVVGRFMAEARAAAAVEHPAIVEVLDCDVTPDGRAFLVMEFLRGESLRETLDRDSSVTQDARFLAAVLGAAADGLGAAHAEGIVHRDLKPDNIFLSLRKFDSPTLQIKILDFGIAKLIQPDLAGAKTQTGALLGTPHYMSPEQCRGAREIDHRSDIYSLGCVAFEMFAGRRPFIPESIGMLLISHATEPAPPIMSLAPHTPPPIASLIDSMLRKDPGARPQVMAEVVAQLAAFLRCDSNGFQTFLAAPVGFPRGEPEKVGIGGTPSPMHVPAPTPVVRDATAALSSPSSMRAVSTIGDSAMDLPSEGVRFSSRTRFFAMLSGAAALLILGGVLLSRSGRPEAPPTPKLAATPAISASPAALPTQVAIAIDSKPRGAEVWLAGESAARGNTPFSLNVSIDDTALSGSLRLPGYIEQPFSASRTVAAKLDFELQPLVSKPVNDPKAIRAKTRRRVPVEKDDPYGAVGD